MAPNGGGQPTGELAAQINTDFGSFDAFKKEMCAKSAAVKGTLTHNVFFSKSKYLQDLAGAGSDGTRKLPSCRSLLVRTRTPLKLQLD